MENPQREWIVLLGRKRVSVLTLYLMRICTLGLTYAACRLSMRLKIILETTESSIDEAELVQITDHYGNNSLCFVDKVRAPQTLQLKRYLKNGFVRILNSSYGRFIFDHILGRFVIPKVSQNCRKVRERLNDVLLKSKEEEKIELEEKRILYGENNLSIEVPSFMIILLNNIFSPYFLWETASVYLWVSISYYYYASVFGVIYLILFFKGILGDLRNRARLMKMNVRKFLKVLRNGSFQYVDELNIYPGDLLLLERTDSLVCDCEVLSGDVIVEESFLTGEPVPIFKSEGASVYSGTKILKSTGGENKMTLLDSNLLRVKNKLKHKSGGSEHSNSIGDCFSECALGLVVKTGKNTKRGHLTQSIVRKRPFINKLATESNFVIKWIICSAVVLTVIVFIYLIKFVKMSLAFEISFDFTITLFNPTLYTALELGTQYARDQLFNKKVNTTETKRINTAGEVDMVVFDKTGTLTELGVDILSIDTINANYEAIQELDPLIHMGLSTCHYVLELDNQYSGDILDMKMFLFSKSKICNKENKRFIDLSSNNEFIPICKEQNVEESDSVLFFNSVGEKAIGENLVEVLKIYDFDLYLKRMSVVIKNRDNRLYLFCKGAPDSISKILKIIPEEYNDKIKEYGLQGHRVLTLAYKELKEYGKRELDETNLTFLGFIIFANKLKEETEDVIKELREANIKPKMCTGDNILTAISVARECKMIDSYTPVLFPVVEDNLKSHHDADWFCVADEDYVFDKIKMQLYMDFDRSTPVDFVVAIEGKEFEFFRNTIYHSFILEKGVVFARFNPENKKELIEDYSRNDYVTMFCGDGANDTGALSSADVGLSLATNEASLAASFNSLNITAVIDLIKEGRSALAMSATQFKYVFYSQVLASLQILFLVTFMCFPSDLMSLINDLTSFYVFSKVLSNFKAAKYISPKKPNINISRESLKILYECGLICVFFILTTMSTESPPFAENVNTKSVRSTIIYPTTHILLVYKAISYCDYGAHRQSRRSNISFMITALVLSGISIVLLLSTIYQTNWVLETLEYSYLSSGEQILSLGLAILSVTTSFIFDHFLR